MLRLVRQKGRSIGFGVSFARAISSYMRKYGLECLLALALPALAHGATRHVAHIGNDGPNCGVTLSTACRSITQAIALAASGDIILVGPGRYGDLNRNGSLGDIGGEETGSPGCSCVVSINKNVIVISSAGASVTTIDGRSVDVIQNVLVITVGGEFGRPGKGFTVTQTASSSGSGIVLDSVNVMVRGNQVIDTRIGTYSNHGIITVNDAAIRIEGNQVINWDIGIRGRGAATLSRNQVMSNNTGILASGGNIVGNVATSNCVGISLGGSATATSNAASMNRCSGFRAGPTFSGVFTKNNLFANSPCGLENSQVPGLEATNNYWGVDVGPGTPAADNVCNDHGGTTLTSPFATKPFTVKVLKP